MFVSYLSLNIQLGNYSINNKKATNTVTLVFLELYLTKRLCKFKLMFEILPSLILESIILAPYTFVYVVHLVQVNLDAN